MEYLNKLVPFSFYFLATASVLCSLGMIFNKNLVRAGFTLIGSFVAIAGIYFMLSANFVGVSQILIYAVGIVLVIVFAIMLCSLKDPVTQESADEDSDNRQGFSLKNITAFIFSCGIFGLLVNVINSIDWVSVAKINNFVHHDVNIAEISKIYTNQIGSLMLNDYILGFELVSVLLLIVLIGVIVISKKEVK
jgi:NADH-quinone oxidoreductase subunit J